MQQSCKGLKFYILVKSKNAWDFPKIAQMCSISFRINKYGFCLLL